MAVIRIYFSDYFEVYPADLKAYGAYNISLINDLPLFIDPFLLFGSDKKEPNRSIDALGRESTRTKCQEAVYEAIRRFEK